MLIWSLALLLALALLGAGVLGWTLSSRVIVPQPYALSPEFTLGEVVDLGGGDYRVSFTLPAGPVLQHGNVEAVGTYGILWNGGHGALGPLVDPQAGSVAREVRLLAGDPPRAGDPARLDNFYYRADPASDLSLPFEELSLAGAVGRLRAWYVPSEQNTAVLVLHGRRRGELIETLRFVEALNGMGLPTLALAYRNHDASAASPDGLYHYGASEWQDALVGAGELKRRGHERVILYGISMGGAVALEALKRWPTDAPEVVGVVLDSPLVSPRAVVEVGAAKAGLPLPRLLTRLALFVASMRTRADFGSLEQATDAHRIGVPLLVIAGEDDTTVPVAAIDDFVAQVRAPLTYLRLPGVEHVEAWNHDPARYAGWLRSFIASLEVRAAADRAPAPAT